MFETATAFQPGAVMMEWNVAGAAPGAAGLWDVHFRIGGSAGTQMELEQCAPRTSRAATPSTRPASAPSLLLHVSARGALGLPREHVVLGRRPRRSSPEAKSQQIDIFNGRGRAHRVGRGPRLGLWHVERSTTVLYNYQVANATAVYLSLIQTETPYFQGNPAATEPFAVNAAYKDPDFKRSCQGSRLRADVGRAADGLATSSYGAGSHSFFDNYPDVPADGAASSTWCRSRTVRCMVGLSTEGVGQHDGVNGQGVVFDRGQPKQSRHAGSLQLVRGIPGRDFGYIFSGNMCICTGLADVMLPFLSLWAPVMVFGPVSTLFSSIHRS